MAKINNTHKGLPVAYVVDYYYDNKKDCTKVGQTTYFKKRISTYKSKKKYTKAVVRFVEAFDTQDLAIKCENAFRDYFIAQGGVQFGKDQIRKRHFKKSDIPNLKALVQSVQAD